MHHINHMRTSDEPILVDKIQSIAALVWCSSIEGNGATTDDIDFFRSNPLYLQWKKSLRSNTFALRTNGKNENQYVCTEKFAEVWWQLFLVPVNFTRWREWTCQAQLALLSSLIVDQLCAVIWTGQEARTKLIRGNTGLVEMISKHMYHIMVRNGCIGHSIGTNAILRIDNLAQGGYNTDNIGHRTIFDPPRGIWCSTYYVSQWTQQMIICSIAEKPLNVSFTNLHLNNDHVEYAQKE